MTDQILALDGLAPGRRDAPSQVDAAPCSERRGLFNRRLRDRRSADKRINAHAPRSSRLSVWSCWALSATGTVFLLIVIAGEVIYQRQLAGPLTVAGALMALSVVAFMLGMIEQRLIEIRLELMMANGGGRRGDRSAAADDGASDRRKGDRRRSDRIEA